MVESFRNLYESVDIGGYPTSEKPFVFTEKEGGNEQKREFMSTGGSIAWQMFPK